MPVAPPETPAVDADGTEREIVALLVEDDDVDARTLRRALRGPGGAAGQVELERATTLERGIARLGEGGVDVLLLDLSLPDSTGVESVRRVREQDPEVPIVVFTGADDDDTALEALQAGGQDYLVKDELSTPLLKRSLWYAIERKRIEREAEAVKARLVEVQKHEGLASLASGIAHDFNNLLTVALGNTELVQRGLAEGSPDRKRLAAAAAAARTAARLTEQLLAYAGDRPFRRERLDLSALVAGMKSVLERLLGEDLSLSTDLPEGLPPVEGDRSQLQQLLLNLVVNAVEAMDEGPGTIEISTAQAGLDAAATQALIGGPCQPGLHVSLRVRDSGCGLKPDLVGRIFDPFYSSKFPGRGLGLAASLGIARGHAAGFTLETAPGAGACFTLHVPALARRSETLAEPRAREAPFASATVLVVDDEPGVRELVEHMLGKLGHTVVLAEGGARAVEILRAKEAPIDLVLLDLTMPDMSGERTFRQLRALRPGVPVVLMSGYDAFQVMQRFEGTQPPPLLSKPFDPEDLAAAIEEALADDRGRQFKPAGWEPPRARG